jgi:hypothetical protein
MRTRLRDFASSTATALCVVAVALLAYIAGAWAAWLNTFPVDPFLRPAFVGASALLQQYVTPVDTDVWMENPGVGGIMTNKAEAAYDGFTLVTTGQGARLLAMNGDVLHEWHLPYDEITAPEARTHPDYPESWLYWRPARLFPNGDLIAIVDACGSTPEGLALIKIDRQSRLIWAYRAPVHHDFDIDEAGNIYVLDQQIRQRRPQQLWALDEPMLDESLIVLSRDGEEIRRVSILDAFARSSYRDIVNRLAPGNVSRWGDYLHNNNVELVTAELAPAFPFLKAGQVILSMRQLDTIAALDLEREEIVWAIRGSWHRQHDPDLLANGNILLFDNKGDWARGGRSRVLQIDPTTSEIVWTWPSSKGGELWSSYRADQQMLPNGNVLINEFVQGRLVEVTSGGEVVWEFISPFRDEQNHDRVARIMFAERYPRNWIAFEPVAVTSTDRVKHGDRG